MVKFAKDYGQPSYIALEKSDSVKVTKLGQYILFSLCVYTGLTRVTYVALNLKSSTFILKLINKFSITILLVLTVNQNKNNRFALVHVESVPSCNVHLL